jgi:putative transposase
VARKPRREIAPGTFHVFARGVDKQLIFRDEVDCRTYLSLLGAVVEEMDWRCFAYCLMKNHLHLMLETSEPNLGRGMQRLHGRYGAAFNARHGRVGPLFQGRFGATEITTDAQFAVALAYVIRNPVAAGLCDSPAAWPWSSHRPMLDGSPPAWLDAPGLLTRLSLPGSHNPLERYHDLAMNGVVGTEGTVPVVSFTAA